MPFLYLELVMLARHDRDALRAIERGLEHDDPAFACLIRVLAEAMPGRDVLPRCATIVAVAGLVLIPVGFVVAAPLGWIGVGLAGLGAWVRLVLAWADRGEIDQAGQWGTSCW